MEALVVVLLVLLVAGVGIGIFFIVRKQQYIKAIRARGWQWVERPALGIAVGLNNPPFGVGFSRSVDDQIVGTSSTGIGFQAFRYRAPGFPNSTTYVLTMKLPHSLPEFYAFTSATPRPLVDGRVVHEGTLTAVTTDMGFGTRAWSAMAPGLQNPPLGSEGTPLPVDVSIDHDQLVMLHVPRDPADVAAAVEWLAGIRQALLSSPAMETIAAPAPQHLSFHRRPHWQFIPRDDSMLSQVSYTRSGQNHRAEDIIVSDNFGLPFIRLTHHWETTSTSTDSKGNTSTTTHHHKEHIAQFRTTFPFREISLNWGFLGQKVRFESTAFNDKFTVRSPIARFASDVIHPRQMEYLLATVPVPFSIEPDGRIELAKREWTPEELDWFSGFLRGFFARVPDFTWKELGAWPRPIPELDTPGG